jgi:hypothetical protein
VDVKWGEVVDSLHRAGFTVWAIILVIFGMALIFKGPEYGRVIATFFNERRRINGDLSRKLERLHLGVERKRAKLGQNKGKNPHSPKPGKKP